MHGKLQEMGLVNETKEIYRKWGWPDVERYEKGKCLEEIEGLVKKFQDKEK